jgi:uncharacterized protein YcbX
MSLIVSELYTYPVKGCAGIPLQTSEVTSRGLSLDRRWMVVDDTGVFISQRSLPQLGLLQPLIREGEILLQHERKGYHTLAIPIEDQEEADKMEVVVWQDRVPAQRVSDQADEWISKILGVSAHLVRMPESSQRMVDPEYARNKEIVSFADGYPFLIVGQASLNDLNQRVGKVLSIKRFRPNIVFTGGAPYAEDGWQGFRIGETIFFAVKPCARCKVTTIDPITQEAGPEPLKTLATYRSEQNKVMFGMNLLSNGKGSISIGDEIELL